VTVFGCTVATRYDRCGFVPMTFTGAAINTWRTEINERKKKNARGLTILVLRVLRALGGVFFFFPSSRTYEIFTSVGTTRAYGSQSPLECVSGDGRPEDSTRPRWTESAVTRASRITFSGLTALCACLTRPIDKNKNQSTSFAHISNTFLVLLVKPKVP
jgi:hypothetical protein